MNLGQTPTLEQHLANAAENGWAFFNGPLGDEGAPKRPPEDRMKRLAAIAAALYEAPEFRELLGFLAETTLHRPVVVAPIGVEPLQGWGYAMFREGQNATTQMIFKMIAQGRDETIEGREP